METELFALFDSIINGYLNPNLTANNDCSRIEKLLEVRPTFDEAQNKDVYESDYPSASYYLTHCVKKDTEISFKNYPQNPDKKLLITSEELWEMSYKICRKKGKFYKMVLGIEEEVICHKIYSFIESSKNLEENKFFAWKSIKKIKRLANDLKNTIDCNIRDSVDAFIFSSLKDLMIHLLLFIEDTFHPLIERSVKSPYKLRLELFNEDRFNPSFRAFTLLPFNVENNRLRLEYFNGIYETKTVGKYLFDHYKERYIQLDTESKIKNYLKELHFWKEQSISISSNFLFDNEKEPEIDKVLIPLLEEEINMLKLLDEAQNIKTGFETKLSTDQKTDLYNIMKGQHYIESTPENFKALLTAKIVPENYQKVRWILPSKSNSNSPHKSALNEFLELVISEPLNLKKIQDLVADKNGKSLKPIKPKPKERSNYYLDLESILNNL